MSCFVEVSIYSNPFGVEYPKIRTVVLKEIYLSNKDPRQQWDVFVKNVCPLIPRTLGDSPPRSFGNKFERWKEMIRMGLLEMIHTTFEWVLFKKNRKYSMIRFHHPAKQNLLKWIRGAFWPTNVIFRDEVHLTWIQVEVLAPPSVVSPFHTFHSPWMEKYKK